MIGLSIGAALSAWLMSWYPLKSMLLYGKKKPGPPTDGPGIPLGGYWAVLLMSSWLSSENERILLNGVRTVVPFSLT